MLEIKCIFQEYSKKLEKIFSSFDNCTSIGCRKFSGLQRKYFSSGVNVLKTELLFHILPRKRFSNWNFNRAMTKANKTTLVLITAVFGTF